jgi:hypothetical protein
LNSLPVEQGYRGEEAAEMTQRDLELVDIKEMGVIMKDQDFELIEEKVPCLEN